MRITPSVFCASARIAFTWSCCSQWWPETYRLRCCVGGWLGENGAFYHDAPSPKIYIGRRRGMHLVSKKLRRGCWSEAGVLRLILSRQRSTSMPRGRFDCNECDRVRIEGCVDLRSLDIDRVPVPSANAKMLSSELRNFCRMTRLARLERPQPCAFWKQAQAVPPVRLLCWRPS